MVGDPQFFLIGSFVLRFSTDCKKNEQKVDVGSLQISYIFARAASNLVHLSTATKRLDFLKEHHRLLVVGLFSKVGGALLYRELGEPPGGMDGKGLGRDGKKPRALLSRHNLPVSRLKP